MSNSGVAEDFTGSTRHVSTMGGTLSRFGERPANFLGSLARTIIDRTLGTEKLSSIPET
jgi:hypothetical protein